jgi:hypothetical protein
VHYTAHSIKPVSSKPKMTDLERLEFVPADIDKNAEGERLSVEDKELLLARLQDVEFCKGLEVVGVPTFIIDSGVALRLYGDWPHRSQRPQRIFIR